MRDSETFDSNYHFFDIGIVFVYMLCVNAKYISDCTRRRHYVNMFEDIFE